MKINFNHIFKDENGNNVVLNQADKKPLSFKEAAKLALLYPPTSKTVSASEKIKRHDLAVRIYNFPESVILNEQEKPLLIEALGDVFIPIVVGAANAIMEGKEPPTFNKEVIEDVEKQ